MEVLKALLEICCYGLESARTAQAAGADRIELCADPFQGGTTPSVGLIQAARKALQIPLNVIIRPRGGDFCYSEPEMEVMLRDVAAAKQLGCDGVVVGMLLPQGMVDRTNLQRLLEKAYPLDLTFHRAFDWVLDPLESLDLLIELGVERILTSGQAPDALSGAATIRGWMEHAGDQILIMPGGGVRASNLLEIAQKTGSAEFHSSAGMVHPSSMKAWGGSLPVKEIQWPSPDPSEIRAMKKILSPA